MAIIEPTEGKAMFTPSQLSPKSVHLATVIQTFVNSSVAQKNSMAARIAHFTWDQVAEEVCTESEINVENEDLQLSFEEACGLLLSVYHGHEEGSRGMDKALLCPFQYGPWFHRKLYFGWMD